MTRLSPKQLQTAVANGSQVIEYDKPVVATAVIKRIPMAPFGKERPRVTANGTYMPRDYERKRKLLRWQFGEVPGGLVHLSVTAVRQMPKDWSKVKRERMRGRYAAPEPDTDNILGAVMDSLWERDNAVISVFCEKVWGDKPELVIEVAPVQED
jgi:Holliday junction resolvase RusA-like endonuclease